MYKLTLTCNAGNSTFLLNVWPIAYNYNYHIKSDKLLNKHYFDVEFFCRISKIQL